MVENGFFYAACKNSERIAREENKKQKASIKFRDICNKYNTDIYGLSKNNLTKTEYTFIVNFITVIQKLPIDLYPNLQ